MAKLYFKALFNMGQLGFEGVQNFSNNSFIYTYKHMCMDTYNNNIIIIVEVTLTS